MLTLTFLLIFLRALSCTRTSSLRMYNRFFNRIRKEMENDRDEKDTLDAFEQEFYANFSSQKSNIVSSSLDMNISSEIGTVVNAFKFDEKMGTYAYGTESQDSIVKILISGAKGTKVSAGKKQISTLALSEIVESNQTANAIVYASKISDTEYIIDAKAEEAEGKSEINSKGQYVICKSVGRRYVFDSLKTAYAINKMFRLVIGSDYVKFSVNVLMAGASVRSTGVVSKSIIKIIDYIITADDKKARTNIGLFMSDNATDDKQSKSKHFGFLRIENSKSRQEQVNGGTAYVDAKNTDVNGYFLEFLTLTKK